MVFHEASLIAFDVRIVEPTFFFFIGRTGPKQMTSSRFPDGNSNYNENYDYVFQGWNLVLLS